MVKPDFKLMSKLLSMLKPVSSEVLVGAEFGEDASVIKVCRGRVLVAHPDPISGAVELIGRLAVHIPANDVAVTGAEPKYFLITMLIPQELTNQLGFLESMIREVSKAADELNAYVVGGHTEFTDAVVRPLIVTTAIGFTGINSFIKTSGARPGDAVIITKTAGIEGTAVLATDFKEELLDAGVPREAIDEGARMVEKVSVVKEALALVRGGVVNSMHDPTEGGIIGGLTELAYASGTSVTMNLEDVPISECTKELTSALGINPLKILASGSLIASVPKELVGEALSILRAEGVKASVIGYVTSRRDYLLRVMSGGRVVEEYREPFTEDEVIKLWLRRKSLSHGG